MALELKRVGQAVGRRPYPRARLLPAIARRLGRSARLHQHHQSEDLLRPTNEMAAHHRCRSARQLTQIVVLDVGGRPLEGQFLRSTNLVNSASSATRHLHRRGPRRHASRHRRQTRRPGPRPRRRRNAGRTSPTPSTPWPQPHRPGPQHRRKLPPPSHPATLSARSPSTCAKFCSSSHQHHGRPAALLRLEVTHVAREVGTDGKLGGQAVVPGVAGTWKDLTDSVNAMADSGASLPESATSPKSPLPSPAAYTARSPSTSKAKSSRAKTPSTP